MTIRRRLHGDIPPVGSWVLGYTKMEFALLSSPGKVNRVDTTHAYVSNSNKPNIPVPFYGIQIICDTWQEAEAAHAISRSMRDMSLQYLAQVRILHQAQLDSLCQHGLGSANP